MKLTIRLKLLIGFTLLLTLSSLVQGLSFFLTKQYILAQVNSAQEVETNKGANEIDNFFTTLRKESAKLAQVYEENSKDITPVGNYTVKNNDYIRQITYLSLLGREEAKFDTSGQVPQEKLSYEVFSVPFKSAVAGNADISKVYYVEKGLGPHLDMFYPLFGEKKTVVGVVKLQINLNQLRDELASIKLGKSGFIYVVDDQGRLIAHPSEEFVLQRPKLSSRKVIFNALADTKSTPKDEQYDNEKNMGVVAKAVKIPRYNWVVVLEQPVSEAFGFLNFIQNMFIITLIGSLILFLIIAFFLSENLTRPIRKLEQSAHQIRMGQLEKTVVIKSGDEIESLSQSFASLIDQLLQREHSLEKTTTELGTANERLKELDKLKDEFVSVASHELRTPMTAIKSYLWMALDGRGGPVSEKQKFYLTRAYGSVDRLIRLVSDMLNVSRIDSGRVSVQLKDEVVKDLVQGVFDEVMPRVQELGLTLTMGPAEGLPKVIADSDKIKEVLFNLIGNAMKFTPKGGAITVTFALRDDFVETTVSDTGTGISPEGLAKLFHKFAMVEESFASDKSIQGSGLGLYISKSIIEMHKGRIWASSQGHDKGTQFTFSLKVFHEGDLQKLEQPVNGDKQTVGIIHSEV